jgi:hypothetical protein
LNTSATGHCVCLEMVLVAAPKHRGGDRHGPREGWHASVDFSSEETSPQGEASHPGWLRRSWEDLISPGENHTENPILMGFSNVLMAPRVPNSHVCHTSAFPGWCGCGNSQGGSISTALCTSPISLRPPRQWQQ